jgi:hypothetical protein
MGREMEKSGVTGFDIRIGGVWRTFRDQQPAAYEASLLLKQRNKSAAGTIADTATGTVVTMVEDGRTAYSGMLNRTKDRSVTFPGEFDLHGEAEGAQL